MKAKTIEHANKVICALQKEYPDGVIKDVEMPPLVNINTKEDVGFCVLIHLANKYEYTDDILKGWKKRVHADGYGVTAKHNQLAVKFYVHFDKKEKEGKL